ncbi:MAG TPA: MOSC N-terminal beta barrel domain-containing protein [Terriglobales bacterium]|nr:MOSC N-terminal beta barrel domain-containing protein [Terriglobales bacterium]
MNVLELWRYPVKSMAGERLQCATLGPLGVEGDRVVHVEDSRGRFITSRTHPRLLGHHAKLGVSGEPEIDDKPWTEPEVLRRIIEIGGPDARLVRDDSAQRFDILPLLVATDGSIAAFGRDGRRLRPNIVVGGVEGLEERSWEGKCLRIGDVLIGIEDLRARCVMTTFDPDTLKQDHNVLRDIVRRFDGKLALNCWVIQGGKICVNDEVELIESCEREKAVAEKPF